MSEHNEQVCLFQWAAYNESAHPELALLHAIPNGGLRHKAVAAKMRREGVRPGVPDVCLPVARGGSHGLYIEMKFGKNKPTEHQTEWIKMLRSGGYRVEICYSCEDAIEVIEDYLIPR